MSELGEIIYDENDVIIKLKLSVNKDALEQFNRLGLSDKARRLALSYRVQDVMEHLGDNPQELAWYVEQAAKVPDPPKRYAWILSKIAAFKRKLTAIKHRIIGIPT